MADSFYESIWGGFEDEKQSAIERREIGKTGKRGSLKIVKYIRLGYVQDLSSAYKWSKNIDSVISESKIVEW